MAAWHTLNILYPNGTTRLWQFSASGRDVELKEELTVLPSESLPSRAYSKGWGNIWKRKLNVAWLSPDEVFLRVIQLPVADFAETVSMVEFQLEKLSPIPITQLAWSIYVLPQKSATEQTVVVIMAQRNYIESFLGKLEGNGFFADRLETPLLDRILDCDNVQDSVWINAIDESGKSLISAWWFGGTLRHISFINLPDQEGEEKPKLIEGESSASNTAETAEAKKKLLKAQLEQTIWSGELEGWFGGSASWYISVPASVEPIVEDVVRELSEGNYEKRPLSEDTKIAQLTAKRLLDLSNQSSLVPAEYLDRYKQQFIDKLWMSGVGAVVLIYLAGVCAYFGYLEVLKFQYNRIQSQVVAMSNAYTNALAIKAQIQVLQDQINLKNAVLDAWYAVVQNLPEELTLNSLSFSRGRIVTIFGTAPQDQNAKITEYNGALAKAEINGQKLFSKVSPPTITLRGQNLTWSFNCELNRSEIE